MWRRRVAIIVAGINCILQYYQQPFPSSLALSSSPSISTSSTSYLPDFHACDKTYRLQFAALHCRCCCFCGNACVNSWLMIVAVPWIGITPPQIPRKLLKKLFSFNPTSSSRLTDAPLHPRPQYSTIHHLFTADSSVSKHEQPFQLTTGTEVSTEQNSLHRSPLGGHL